MRASAWPGPLLRLKSIDSTQDLAKRLAEGGAADGTLIVAERQTKGRGRMARRWTSSKGGLYLSAIFRPRVSPRRLGELSLEIAGAAAKAAARLSGAQTVVKPPNDVLARNKRRDASFRKVCGILIEASGATTTDWVVVGLGMNVNNRIPKRLAQAVSLHRLAGKPLDLSRAERVVTQHLLKAYRSFAAK